MNFVNLNHLDAKHNIKYFQITSLIRCYMSYTTSKILVRTGIVIAIGIALLILLYLLGKTFNQISDNLVGYWIMVTCIVGYFYLKHAESDDEKEKK